MQDYVGYRTQKRLQKKKKKRKAWRWLLVLVALFVIFVILGAAVRVYPLDRAWDGTADGFLWLGRKIKSVWPWKKKVALEPEKFLPEGRKTVNYLLAVTKQVDEMTQVSTLVVASYDSRDESGSIIYFPNDLLINTPGIGNEVVSNLVELDQGRISMTLVAVENLLGIEIDRYVMSSDRDLCIVINKLGGKYKVDVPQKINYQDPSLNVSVSLNSGEQELGGRKLVSYLTYSAPDKELDLIVRQKDFVPVFLARSREADVFNDIVAFTKEHANLFDSDASYTEMAGLWQAFALLEGKSLAQATVPVKEFRMEKTVVHMVDHDKLPSFIKKYVKTEAGATASERVRVQILNGCGVPGIGENVASQLDLFEYQVVNSANADHFNYEETIIIVYGDDREITSAAEGVRNELEVGSLQSHPSSQNVTDITIIVGKDYASK